ncbi:MAG: hypothetical protein NC397_04725 [Clostridium sp.]|nr:hypothetical protein [Clostridium sp.]
MSKHKIAAVFLWIINIINVAAGVITQIKLLNGSDVTSVIPITVNMTVNQILLLNFMVVTIIMTLICIVTMCITVDVSYTPAEVIKNCAGIFLVPAIIIFGVSIVSMIKAPDMLDKISILISFAVYVLLNAVNVGCVLTVMEDNEL